MHVTGWKRCVALALLVCAPLAYVWKYVRGSTAGGMASFDIYAQAYPLMIQTVAAVADGGRGLLWNAMQNCGQPFFGTGITGLLYPGNLGFFFADPDTGLHVLLAFNFLVACLSAYALCLELGMGVLAACCGGLAFGLGTASISFNTSTLLLGGPYVWYPAVMLFCERILRAPSTGNALGLAVTIALTLVPGHPQFVLYLLQLIGARVLWELVTRWRGISWRTVAALLGGLLFGPLLIAVQLVPGFEVGSESIRGRALSLTEMSTGGFLTWSGIRNQLAWRWDNGQPFLVLPCILAVAALWYRPGWRLLSFYGLIGVLALDLSTGTNGFFFPIYSQLPLVSLFRNPNRMLIITSFSLALLAAGGVEAATGRDQRSGVRNGVIVALLLLAGLIAMYWLIPNRLNPSERWLGAVVIAAGGLAAARARARPSMGLVILAALGLHLVYFRGLPLRGLLPDGEVLFAHRPLYAALAQRMSPQDRTYVVHAGKDHSLQQKTGALFGVPAVFDYHSQISQRYADYFSTLRTGTPMRDYNQWAYQVSGLLPRTLNHRLLNLAAGTYLVVSARAAATNEALQPMVLEPELSNDTVRVYRNPAVLPRAFWVGRVEIVAQPAALLERLAKGSDDLREVALLEAVPASGFVGAPAPPAGALVAFTRNDPEHITLRVSAPARGFVVVADQHFPGWHAQVNGVATPIERANYVFRLVEVPAGDSVVDFRYAPASLKVGAAISIAACLVLAGLLLQAWRGGAAPLPEPAVMR